MIVNRKMLNDAIMANKLLEETNFKQAIEVNADSMGGYVFGEGDDKPELLIQAFFASVARYLSLRKITSDDKCAALVVQDLSGKFKFAGVVEYTSNENPDEPGNWNYWNTFDENDITDLEKRKSVVKYIIDDAFKSVMYKTGYEVCGLVFDHFAYMYDCCLLVVDTIVQILDAEAKEGEVVEISLPGFFIATVAVENGEKVMSISPEGHMKAIIKDDSMLD